MSENNNKKYVVVKFPISDNIQEETVAVVPSSWINYNLNICKWPPKKYAYDKVSRWVMSLTSPKDDFDDIPIEIMHQYDTYSKARKASIKAEEESAIDTAAGETDIEKCRRRRKPVRYEDSSGPDDDFVSKKSKKTKYSFVNDSSDEEISTTENIKAKVRTLLKKKDQSPSLLSHSKKPRTVKRTVLPSPSYTPVCNSSSSPQSSFFVQDTCPEVDENLTVKPFFNDVYNPESPKTSSNRNESPLSESTSSLITGTSSEVLDKTSSVVKTFSNKTATSQTCSKLYNNPSCSNAPLLGNKLPMYGTSSLSFERTISPSETSTKKDTSISYKSVTPQPSHKSSLPSLMKNVHMQLEDSHIGAVLQILVDRQEELNGKMEHVILMLHRIYRKVAPEEEKIIKPTGLPALPLTNEDAFLEFQKFLLSDINFYPVVDYFSKLMKVDKQTDEYTAVGRILPKVITNSLARMINYAGSGSVKLKFEDTKLHEAINCAVFKSFPNSNLTQAEKKMSRWFQTSNQRKI